MDTPKCPICNGPMWSNIEKKKSGEFSPKAPDYKCKKKSCEGVIWPGEKGKDNPNPRSPQEFQQSLEPEYTQPKKPVEPNWDKIAEGKIRSLFIEALIQYRGLSPLTAEEANVLTGLVYFAMTGQLKNIPPVEDIDTSIPDGSEEVSPDLPF